MIRLSHRTWQVADRTRSSWSVRKVTGFLRKLESITDETHRKLVLGIN